MSAQPSRRAPQRSPRPVCPDPYCSKVWSPTREDAKRMRAEIMQENGDRSPVRFYEHAGGWHWTRRINKKDA